MYRNYLSVTLGLFCCWLSIATTVCCGQEIGNAKSSSAVLQEFRWIAGQWQGEALGGAFEETWNPPAGDSLVGMFKSVKDGKTAFYELMTITMKGDQPVLRIKHFGADLKGWEEKDQAVEFPYVRHSEKELVFQGLRFVRKGSDQLEIRVMLDQKNSQEETVFAAKRMNPGS